MKLKDKLIYVVIFIVLIGNIPLKANINYEKLDRKVINLNKQNFPSDCSSYKEEDRKIVIATYRTSLNIIQFRKNKLGDIYVYSLFPNQEKLLLIINNQSDPLNLTNDEKYYFFIYNLIFIKSEILLTFGSLKGQEFEIFIDKELQAKAIYTGKPENFIKVYLKNNNSPVKTFQDFEELYKSQFLVLLYK
ncbi:hypothetical protein ETU10_08135 [Apibacter muscae]|uniref:Uncharacterized protein n=1 Tax=Apibacter muscae TaxID=2509004 RepID=A0A563DAN5_9FLAO|nr:hypothetical protein [Apibacter muscae]TWP23308.1 hypothetical protein ETU10_08135 [Apibacter muscae]TWP26844.1 hypothetical protein ETU09_09820 [Apibacter muscae]